MVRPKTIPEEHLEKVTHAHTILKCHDELEKYPSEPDCMSRGRTALSARPTTGRQTSVLSDQLVCHNTGPMGTEYGMGIPNRLCGDATTRITTNSSTLHLGAGYTNTGGSSQTSPETGNTTCGVPLGEGLLLQHFPGPQKRWRTETCHQPQGTKQLCSQTALFTQSTSRWRAFKP